VEIFSQLNGNIVGIAVIWRELLLALVLTCLACALIVLLLDAMPDNPVKAKISVMNWVQAADDASKVTPDIGLKDADKLDSNIR
ncbi:hypothetical protein MJL33_33780, partial [Salmonella enterica subsp. enterica serovar Kentucky]|nr:hypothetical protein [Salmonella enterica subsp. enterica serovar Kentucky]